MNISDIFINNLLRLAEQKVSDRIESHIRNSLLDYIGCAVAGSTMLQPQIEYFLESGVCSIGDCPVFGTDVKYSMKDAAFLNGIYSHVLEIDDGHRFATMHLAAPIFSALLAVCEKERLSYSDLIRGAIVGYETAIRLSIAMQPNHKKRGFHTTGTCGTIGVAMAVAFALKFDFSQVKTALSAAVSSAAGVLEMLSDDSQLKPYNVGRAAMDGIQAAYVGKAGFESPNDPLMGKRGFFATMTDGFDIGVLEHFDYKNLYCIGSFFKPYAACRHCHPAIEASILLKEELGDKLRIDEILSIKVKAYDLAIVGHDHISINGVNAAKMSIPYGVAVGLIEGHAGINDFNESVYCRPDVKKLTSKVSVEEDPELSALIPNKRASIVEVVTTDACYIKRVDVAKGEPENPMTKVDIINKFYESTKFVGLSEVKSRTIVERVLSSDITIAMFEMTKSIFV